MTTVRQDQYRAPRKLIFVMLGINKASRRLIIT
jgi:hypothetical protein